MLCGIVLSSSRKQTLLPSRWQVGLMVGGISLTLTRPWAQDSSADNRPLSPLPWKFEFWGQNPGREASQSWVTSWQHPGEMATSFWHWGPPERSVRHLLQVKSFHSLQPWMPLSISQQTPTCWSTLDCVMSFTKIPSWFLLAPKIFVPAFISLECISKREVAASKGKHSI